MLRLWRLYRAAYGPGLDGIGGTFASGRWHLQGQRVVYFGETPAIVVLERLAHTDPDLLPGDLQLGCFEFQRSVRTEAVEDRTPLPGNWVLDEQATRKAGTGWLRENSSALLKVPSVLLPEESNYLFNPRHPDGQHLQPVSQRPFAFDPRLL
ncbi:MAG TPA: RES family NAD+ phosphorylase [Bryobacteraceae bacterium]